MSVRSFTYDEVKMIFQLSENVGLSGKHIGHAGKKHVMIDKDSLGERQTFEVLRLKKDNEKGAPLSLYTAFRTFHEQITAAVAILNHVNQQGKLAAFDRALGRGAELVITDAPLDYPTPMRYAIGGGGQVFPCRHFTLWGRKEFGRPHDLHIVSFFGTMGDFGRRRTD
jgi:hypothetical protein